jgi:uncharacterized membrane protein YjjB (DUF3815 family)
MLIGRAAGRSLLFCIFYLLCHLTSPAQQARWQSTASVNEARQEVGVAAFGAAVAAAAFAFSSYSPKRILVPVALVAAVAMSISQVIQEPGLGRTWSVALAALFVGLVGYALAGRLRVPPLILVVSAVVPMLPGLSIFRGLSLLAEGNRFNTSEGLVALMTAASVALALAAGVILGEYVAQPLKREARRVESRLAGPRLVGPIQVLGRRGRTPRRRRDSGREGQSDWPNISNWVVLVEM